MANETGTWLEKELSIYDEQKKEIKLNYPQKLILEENKIIEIEIDFNEPFEKVQDAFRQDILKAKIPVKLPNNELRIWWLNVRNPVYYEILKAGKDGQKKFKILTIGKGRDTKYTIIKD